MAGPTFVEVPAERLLGELRTIGKAVTEKGGTYVEGQVGREIYVDVAPPGGRAFVRVYTSLASGAALARDCGQDAVRLVVVSPAPTPDNRIRIRPLASSVTIKRTAPKRSPDRVGVFLERLRGEVRDAYARALRWPACPLCGRAMVERKGRAGGFYGCLAYPECRGTRGIDA